MLASELAFQKGLYAMDRAKYYAAVDYFSKACKLEPKTGDYHIQLGYAIFKQVTGPQKTTEEAIAHIKKGLVLTPLHVTANRMLAEIERHRGDLEAAVEYLQKAVEEDPKDDEAEIELRELQELLAKRID